MEACSAEIVALMWRFWSIQQPPKWSGWGNHVENKAKLPRETSVMGSWTVFRQGSGKVTVTHTSIINSVKGCWGLDIHGTFFVENIPFFPSPCADQANKSMICCGAVSVKTIRACHRTSDGKHYKLEGVLHRPLLQ